MIEKRTKDISRDNIKSLNALVYDHVPELSAVVSGANDILEHGVYGKQGQIKRPAPIAKFLLTMASDEKHPSLSQVCVSYHGHASGSMDIVCPKTFSTVRFFLGSAPEKGVKLSADPPIVALSIPTAARNIR